MAWVKVDDLVPDHAKHLAAGAEACWLWICGLAYCNRQPVRDGFIPLAKVPVLYPVKSPEKLAAKLVEVGLWEAGFGGYIVHDYHEYQPKAGVTLSEKRAAAGRVGGKRSGETRQANASNERSKLLRGGQQNEFACEANKRSPDPDPDPVPKEDLNPTSRESVSVCLDARDPGARGGNS